AALLDLEDANTKLNEAQAGVYEAEKELAKAQDEEKRVAGEFDRLAKNAAQKSWKLGDWVRKLPVIDGFASPVRIQQTVLEELPIDYAFKRVPRFDRCTTCHLGIDRANFAADVLAGLGTVDEGTDKKLAGAKEMLK